MAGSERTEGELDLRATQVAFVRDVYRPVHRFIRMEWLGSAVLLVASIAAMVWANSPWSAGYEHFWHTPMGLQIGDFSLDGDLRHWINDGLMAVFFFVIGLEVKHEVIHGALSTRKKAALPFLSAVGGMVVPALLFLLVTQGTGAARGWGVPMATDIAFALGVLGLLGSRVPTSLRIFLLALAVVDDLGAILVIAIFYSGPIRWSALAAAGVVLAVIWVLRRAGIREVFAYAVMGVFLWLAIFESGVHATIAGVLLALMTPADPHFDRSSFRVLTEELLDTYDGALESGDKSLAQATLGKLEELSVGNEAPLERAMRHFHRWTSLVILPLFALANAGVSLQLSDITRAFEAPVTMGILVGLVIGKLVGVTLAAWIGVRLGIATLPEGTRWTHVMGVAALAGIGFTVALFITDLAFVDAARIAAAKVGIILASVVAAALGFAILWASGVSVAAPDGEASGAPPRATASKG